MNSYMFRRRMIAAVCWIGVGTACGSSLYPEPVSDSQSDDPDAPNTGGPNSPPPSIPDGGTLAVPVLPGDAGAGQAVSFTDLRFVAGGNSLVFAAGGCSGNLYCIPTLSAESNTLSVTTAPDCVTSADPSTAPNTAFLAIADSTANTLSIMNLDTEVVSTPASLAATPSLARVVGKTTAWALEPSAGNIEVFTIASTLKSMTSAATISVGAGATGLVIDSVHNMAYTNSPNGVIAISTTTNQVAGTWPTGCATAGGIAVDTPDNWVFAGCSEGTVVALNAAAGGAKLSSLTVSAGAEALAFDAVTTRHLYVASGASAVATIAKADSTGTLTSVGTFPTGHGAACIATDSERTVFVCDPPTGAVLMHRDLL